MKVKAEVEIGTDLGKDHFPGTLVMIETIGVQAIVGPGQDQQTSLKLLVTNTHGNLNKMSSEWRSKNGTYKLLEGKDDPTIFLPLSTNIGGQINLNKQKN